TRDERGDRMSSVVGEPLIGQATWSRTSRWRRFEGLAAGLARETWKPLAVTLPITVIGLGLVFLAKLPELRQVDRGLATGEIRVLDQVKSVADLEPALAPAFPDDRVRRFVAGTLL